MKKLLKPIIAIVFLFGILSNSAISQTPSADIANTNDNDMDTDDDSGKWGLVGLVGLLGLMGLKKNDKVTGYNTSTTPQNR